MLVKLLPVLFSESMITVYPLFPRNNCYYSHLSPSTHVSDIVSRVYKRAPAIFTVVLSRDIRLLVRAFKVYVRPLLEHDSVIWSPNTLQDIDAMECVQRRFTTRLLGLYNYPNEARLKYLKPQSLELCRRIVDLIWCYKTVFEFVDVNQFFVLSSVLQTRGYMCINSTNLTALVSEAPS